MPSLYALIGPFDLLAVIGGGGKTSLIERLADEFFTRGEASLVTPSTHLGRDQLPSLTLRVEAESVAAALSAAGRAASGARVLLAGPRGPRSMSSNKFEGLPLAWLAAVREKYPGLKILLEADGSRGRPLKAHQAGEPLLPPPPYKLAAVLGLDALRENFPGCCHRPEILCDALGREVPENQPLSLELLAAFITKSWGPLKPDVLFINQADDSAGLESARGLAERIRKFPLIIAGSLRADKWKII